MDNKVIKIIFEYSEFNDRYFMEITYENGDQDTEEITRQIYEKYYYL